MMTPVRRLRFQMPSGRSIPVGLDHGPSYKVSILTRIPMLDSLSVFLFAITAADPWTADELGWLSNFTTTVVLEPFRNRATALSSDENMVTSCRGYEKNWCQGFGGQISLFDEPSDGSLGINYTVSMVETWGGQNEICGHNCGTFPLPNLQLPIRYPCDGATRMSLKLRVGQPLLPGLATQKMALRLLLYDTSHCSYRCNEGRSVEQWYHAWTAEDTLAYNGTEWRELNISLAESVVGDNEDALFGNTFALPLWSGIGGNLKLDPGAVTNWVLQFSMDGQPPNEFNASGQIFVANLTCSGSPDFYNAMDQEESNLYAQPPLGLSGQLSGGSLPTTLPPCHWKRPLPLLARLPLRPVRWAFHGSSSHPLTSI
jgi:hypothetical protein